VKIPARKLFLLTLATALLLPACGRHRERVLEIDYVAAPQVTLRDQLAQVYNKVGVAKNGDRVEVLDRERRFAKIRIATGAEGWVEQRYLVNEQVYKDFQKLALDAKDSPVEGTAVTRNDTNLHVTPGRDTDHLYQLAQGAKVSVLKRGTAERSLPGTPAKGAKTGSSPLEDWWLVRDPENHVGWVLGRLIDLDVPLEVAQYAEGQRIVACFVLNEVKEKAEAGMPIKKAISIAMVASCSVTGSFCAISSRTGTLMRSDSPKSPDSTPLAQ